MHLQAELISANPIWIQRETEKLFSCLDGSSQLGHVITLLYYQEITQERKQIPTLLIKITQKFVILTFDHPIHYSSTNITL